MLSVFFKIIIDIGIGGLILLVTGSIQLLVNKARMKKYPEGKPPPKAWEALVIVGAILVAVVLAIYFLSSIVSSR